jgi:hypothetical protein
MDVWSNLQYFLLVLIYFLIRVAAPLSLGFLILNYPEYISDTHIEIIGWCVCGLAGWGLRSWMEEVGMVEPR